MKTRTDKQIATELSKLKDLAPRIRQSDIFGGDNRAKIDAQIEVLDDLMSESEIYDLEDNGDWDGDTASCAIEALNWMNGEEEEPPSEGWANLAK